MKRLEATPPMSNQLTGPALGVKDMIKLIIIPAMLTRKNIVIGLIVISCLSRFFIVVISDHSTMYHIMYTP
jgi:hypothetical protein